MKFSMMMAKEMSRMQGYVTKIPGAPTQIKEADPDCYADSPFAASIGAVDIPKKYCMPSMNMYDGTQDPHIAEYKQRSYSIPVAIREVAMCKSFGSTLKGPALRWLINVPNNTIRSFAQLVNMFNMQFASSRMMEKQSADLYLIVQGATKSLKSYLSRLNGEMISIINCDSTAAIQAFRRGLYGNSELYNKLTMHTFHTFDNVKTKALAYIRLEDDTISKARLEAARRVAPAKTSAPARPAPYVRTEKNAVHAVQFGDRPPPPIFS